MFPLNDTEPNRYSAIPIMTLTIILLNVIVFGYEWSLASSDFASLNRLIHGYGLTPALLMAREGSGVFSVIAHLFLHGGLTHLAGNMLALWVFGRRVEDACGSLRFLLYYLLSGAFAGVITVIIHNNSSTPGIGASGAVFGVMGAYLLLYPGGRIRTYIQFFWLPLFPRLRAIWIILYFLALQIPAAYLIVTYDFEFSTGYWAHLGGFFAAIFLPFFLRPEAFQRYMNEMPV